MEDNTFICERCQSEVLNDAVYCPSCGVLFSEGQKCTNHNNIDAEGVCVICGKSFCNQCGSDVDNLFLCFEHESFEIIQNMVRVFGTPDLVQIEFAKDCLEQENLHPFIYSNKVTPWGEEYSLFRPFGDTSNSINEIKLMVPKNEVLQSIQILKDLELLDAE